jgi:hypothetical protein
MGGVNGRAVGVSSFYGWNRQQKNTPSAAAAEAVYARATLPQAIE